MDCAAIPFIFNEEVGDASHPIGDKSLRHRFGIVSRYKKRLLLKPGHSISSTPCCNCTCYTSGRCVSSGFRIINEVHPAWMANNLVEVPHQNIRTLIRWRLIFLSDFVYEFGEALFGVVREAAFDKWIVQVVTLFLM
jgi:hypothetical protein